MGALKEQYVTDGNGKKVAVILPIKAYKKLLEDREDLEDQALYDKAKKGKQEFIDAEQAFAEIEARRKRKNV